MATKKTPPPAKRAAPRSKARTSRPAATATANPPLAAAQDGTDFGAILQRLMGGNEVHIVHLGGMNPTPRGLEALAERATLSQWGQDTVKLPDAERGAASLLGRPSYPDPVGPHRTTGYADGAAAVVGPTSFETLVSRIFDLHDVIDDLGLRLAPVLAGGRFSPIEMRNNPAAPSSADRSEVDTLADRVLLATSRLRDVLGKLAL